MHAQEPVLWRHESNKRNRLRRHALAQDAEFPLVLERTTEALSAVDPSRARNVIRLLRLSAGHFIDLVAKTAVASGCDGVKRPPHILTEPGESRRAFAITLVVSQVVALPEHVTPTEMEAVRAAGRDYLARRREWVSRGRYSK